MKAKEFINRIKSVATDYKTLYVSGCFGAPMTESNKKRYTQNNDYNRQKIRQSMINAASADTFGFDCVNLVKGILWGWTGDKTKPYGGARYGSNGLGDMNQETMITKCSNVSADFSKIIPGAFLWMKGHCGIYIGDGLAVECTPKWKNSVQITAVENIGKKPGYNSRTWTKWGLLPWVEYDKEETSFDKDIKIIFNGEIITCKGVYQNGTNYIRLRDLDEKMKICIVEYNKEKGLPEVKTYD